LLDAQEMERLAREYNAPRGGNGLKYVLDPQLARVKAAASALLRHQTMPAERRAELLQVRFSRSPSFSLFFY
jgi:hypothetical protein